MIASTKNVGRGFFSGERINDHILQGTRGFLKIFESILFYDKENRAAEIPPENAHFSVDLNLNQIIDAVIAGKQEYNLKPFFYTPLHDANSIIFRHEIMLDLENNSLMESVKSFAQSMKIVRQLLTLAEKLDFKHFQEGWFLEASKVYCSAVSHLANHLNQAKLKSRGFSAFRDFLVDYISSDSFYSLQKETQKLKDELSSVKYNIIIKDLTVKVRKYEEETDYSVEVEQLFEKFKTDSAKDYRIQIHDDSAINHVEAQILDFVSKLHPGIFNALHAFKMKHNHFIDGKISVFDREIQFYIAYLEFISKFKGKGLEFCYPKIDNSREIYSREGFDLALATKLISESLPVVTNDFYLEGKERILVVTGPNQGGKTTFARAFGQMHYLALLGCPVPGREAKLFLFDKLLTHFDKSENIKDLRGKLEDDLLRIYEILSHATPKSIVIINEIFTSTALKDAVYLSKKIVERIVQLGSLCVWVTFVDELASFSEQTVSMVSTVAPENPAIRTYKIIRKPADGLSYAIVIAEKYRVTYKSLKERFR